MESEAAAAGLKPRKGHRGPTAPQVLRWAGSDARQEIRNRCVPQLTDWPPPGLLRRWQEERQLLLQAQPPSSSILRPAFLRLLTPSD
jgi:hypothetical protein